VAKSGVFLAKLYDNRNKKGSDPLRIFRQKFSLHTYVKEGTPLFFYLKHGL